MMRIGGIEIDNRVALAPMAGVTDLPFRQLCRSLGAGHVVGEMVSSDASLRNSIKSMQRRVHRGEPYPRAIQIVGWDPAMMADAARYNVDQGASIIDINMGCPAKKVLRKAAGSALLGDESRVQRILTTVVSSVSVPVTLKMRTGLDPDSRNGVRIARMAEQCGVSAIAVHGRTRACRYSGAVEYDTIRDICQAVAIPVYANGDIIDGIRAKEILNYTGADGIMIGRGAHGSPWLPGLIAEFLDSGTMTDPPSLVEQASIVQEHLESLYAHYGNFQGVRIARKHIKWYLDAFPNSGPTRAKVNMTDIPDRQLCLVADFYRNLQDNSQGAGCDKKLPN